MKDTDAHIFLISAGPVKTPSWQTGNCGPVDGQQPPQDALKLPALPSSTDSASHPAPPGIGNAEPLWLLPQTLLFLPDDTFVLSLSFCREGSRHLAWPGYSHSRPRPNSSMSSPRKPLAVEASPQPPHTHVHSALHSTRQISF